MKKTLNVEIGVESLLIACFPQSRKPAMKDNLTGKLLRLPSLSYAEQREYEDKGNTDVNHGLGLSE